MEDKFDALLFFIDTQTAHGHEHDIQTLIRTCATKNVPFALNTSTARIVIDGLKQTSLKQWYHTKKSERQDLNLRPPQPHCGALPGCATFRKWLLWNNGKNTS